MIHLYHYGSCPYCSQIKTYLDYFRFNYKLTEVDSFAKSIDANFRPLHASLPIIVFENKLNKNRWILTDLTAILTVLEIIRNDKSVNFSQILNQFQTILKDSGLDNSLNTFKHQTSKSELR
jgi:hypothetical protein